MAQSLHEPRTANPDPNLSATMGEEDARRKRHRSEEATTTPISTISNEPTPTPKALPAPNSFTPGGSSGHCFLGFLEKSIGELPGGPSWRSFLESRGELPPSDSEAAPKAEATPKAAAPKAEAIPNLPNSVEVGAGWPAEAASKASATPPSPKAKAIAPAPSPAPQAAPEACAASKFKEYLEDLARWPSQWRTKTQKPAAITKLCKEEPPTEQFNAGTGAKGKAAGYRHEAAGPSTAHTRSSHKKPPPKGVKRVLDDFLSSDSDEALQNSPMVRHRSRQPPLPSGTIRKRRRVEPSLPESPRPPVAPNDRSRTPVGRAWQTTIVTNDQRTTTTGPVRTDADYQRIAGRSLEPREAPRTILKEWRASDDLSLRQAETTKVGDLVQNALRDRHNTFHATNIMVAKGKDASKQLEHVLNKRESQDLPLLRIPSHLICRRETSNWSRETRLPSGDVLTLGPTGLAVAQVVSRLRFHFGEVRAWPPGTHDEWTALDVPSGLARDIEATEAACGASNPVVNVQARRCDRAWHDWANEGDLWGDPVFDSDDKKVMADDHCNPDLTNAITTFIVRDKHFLPGNVHQWCVRDGQGITLAELLLQFKDTHTYEQLYLSWCSCKLLMRARLGWATPVPFSVTRRILHCKSHLVWVAFLAIS